MVKMEIEDAAVISADRAASARLGNEQPPNFLLPAGDRLSHASLAPPLWLHDPVQRELADAVPATLTELDGLLPRQRRRWSSVLDQGNRRLWFSSAHKHTFAPRS